MTQPVLDPPLDRTAPAEREEARRHLEVVREVPRARPPQTRARFLAVVGVLLATAVAFSLVLLHVVMAQRQIQLDRLTVQVQRQQAAYERLRLEVAQLNSPQHIISTAEGQLNMHQPASVSYLRSPQTATPQRVTSGPPGPAGAACPCPASPGCGCLAPSVRPAPAGDADWPRIKAALAGQP